MLGKTLYSWLCSQYEVPHTCKKVANVPHYYTLCRLQGLKILLLRNVEVGSTPCKVVKEFGLLA